MTPGLSKILPLIASGWNHPPVLVVGDVMLDQYVWGEVNRISPEAPVPVVRTVLHDEKPGGAANVAMNLAALGASVTLVGIAGADREQAVIEAQAAEQGIVTRLIPTPHAPTTTKLRILSGHQQMMRLDSECISAFSADDYRELVSQTLAAIQECSAVVLSDYAKGTLTEEVCQAVISAARRKGVPVLVDPKHQSFERYRGATAICPNRRELAAATGCRMRDLNMLLDQGEKLRSELGLLYMAVTLGDKGIAILQREARIHAPAITQRVFDVSGAGDTVIAILAIASASGVPVDIAAHLANLAAGIVVSKVGTVPVSREELLGALSQNLPPQMDGKVLPLSQLMTRLASWKARGDRIVFTNGCFDILHIGHIRLLEEARRKGDRLIVGLNSDHSVRELKGPSRPIVEEHERSHVLAALSAVDAVVVFDEPTPLRLVEMIRPDILVKGGDYREETVVGAREVRAWGGRLEIIPLVGGVSTTRLIASLARRQEDTATLASV